MVSISGVRIPSPALVPLSERSERTGTIGGLSPVVFRRRFCKKGRFGLPPLRWCRRANEVSELAHRPVNLVSFLFTQPDGVEHDIIQCFSVRQGIGRLYRLPGFRVVDVPVAVDAAFGGEK